MSAQAARALLLASLAGACGGGETASPGSTAPASGAAPEVQAAPVSAPIEMQVDAAPPPPAPKSVVVDLEEHFPGLIEAFFSDRKAAYPIAFEDYEALHGKAIDSRELATLQQRWEDAREVGEAAPPPTAAPEKAASAARVEDRFAAHPYLREALGGLRRFDDLDHFVLFVQPPVGLSAEAADQHAAEVRRKYGAMVDGLERIFADEYAEPLGLEKRPALDPYVLILLDGRAAYDDYSRASDMDMRHARAHYDPEMHVEISYLDPGFETDSSNMHSMLHELVHGIEQAYYSSGGDGMPPATWFVEGFAEYLAYERVARIQASSVRSARRWQDADEAISRLGRQVARENALAACIVPLEVLNTISGYGDAQFEFAERARAHGLEGELDPSIGLELLYPQSHAWFAFLHGDPDADGGPTAEGGERDEWRDDALDFIGRLLKGEPPDAALRAAFAGDELERVNRGFLEFIRAHDGVALAKLVERAR